MWSKNVLFVTAYNHFEGAVCPTTNHYSLLLFRSRHKQWRNTKWVTNPTLHLYGDPGFRSEGGGRGKELPKLNFKYTHEQYLSQWYGWRHNM